MGILMFKSQPIRTMQCQTYSPVKFKVLKIMIPSVGKVLGKQYVGTNSLQGP